MICASVCSGIGAPEAAWLPLGWRCAFASEVDPFARAVYAHHNPGVPLHGDFTKIKGCDTAIDVLVAGTPCQSFSVAGKRIGLDDARGNLTLEYVAMVRRFRPRWFVWENVPGVLSLDGTRTMGTILRLLGECGYGWAWRVLDAQYFGVPQRRRRVILVGHIGGAWQRCAAVLFEPESLRGDPAPRREAGQRVASTIAAGSESGSGYRNDADTADNLIAHTLRADGFDASEDGTGRGTPIIVSHDPACTLTAREYKGPLPEADLSTVVAFDARQRDVIQYGDRAGPLDTDGHSQAVAFAQDSRDEVRLLGGDGAIAGGPSAAGPKVMSSTVRRLTPRECERLMGLPDDHTLVPWRKGMAPDGPRYKAIGNSMAVPVMRWIGERIEAIHKIPWQKEDAA